jgi:hypothetical protein
MHRPTLIWQLRNSEIRTATSVLKVDTPKSRRGGGVSRDRTTKLTPKKMKARPEEAHLLVDALRRIMFHGVA